MMFPRRRRWGIGGSWWTMDDRGHDGLPHGGVDVSVFDHRSVWYYAMFLAYRRGRVCLFESIDELIAHSKRREGGVKKRKKIDRTKSCEKLRKSVALT